MNWDWGSFFVGYFAASIVAVLAIILTVVSLARDVKRYLDTSNCPDVVDGFDNDDKPTPNKERIGL